MLQTLTEQMIKLSSYKVPLTQKCFKCIWCFVSSQIFKNSSSTRAPKELLFSYWPSLQNLFPYFFERIGKCYVKWISSVWTLNPRLWLQNCWSFGSLKHNHAHFRLPWQIKSILWNRTKEWMYLVCFKTIAYAFIILGVWLRSTCLSSGNPILSQDSCLLWVVSQSSDLNICDIWIRNSRGKILAVKQKKVDLM